MDPDFELKSLLQQSCNGRLHWQDVERWWHAKDYVRRNDDAEKGELRSHVRQLDQQVRLLTGYLEFCHMMGVTNMPSMRQYQDHLGVKGMLKPSGL